MPKTTKTSTPVLDTNLSKMKEVMGEDGYDLVMSDANTKRNEIGKAHEKSVDNIYLKQGIATQKTKHLTPWGFAIPDGLWKSPDGKIYWFESTTNLKNPQTLLSKKSDVEHYHSGIQFVLNYNPTQKKEVNVTKTIRRFKAQGWIVNTGLEQIDNYAKSLRNRFIRSQGLVSIDEIRRSIPTYIDRRDIQFHPANRVNTDQAIADIVKSILDGRGVGGFFSSIIVVPESVNKTLTGRYICVDGHTRLKALDVIFYVFDKKFPTKELEDGTVIGEYDIPVIVVDWITSEDTEAMNDLLKKINTTTKGWGTYDFVYNGAHGYEKGTQIQKTYQMYLDTYKFSEKLKIGGAAALVEMVGDKDPQNGWLNRNGLKHGNVATLTEKEYTSKIVPFGHNIAKPLHTFLYENLNTVDTRSYRMIGKFLYESVKRTNKFDYAKKFLDFIITSVDISEIPRNQKEVPAFIDKVRNSMVNAGIVTKKLDSKV